MLWIRRHVSPFFKFTLKPEAQKHIWLVRDGVVSDRDDVVGGREHKRTLSQWPTVPLASQRHLVIHSQSLACRQLL